MGFAFQSIPFHSDLLTQCKNSNADALCIHQTIALVQNAFWSSLTKDMEIYVKAWQVCAQAKTSYHIPAWLLEPLPIPQQPWPPEWTYSLIYPVDDNSCQLTISPLHSMSPYSNQLTMAPTRYTPPQNPLPLWTSKALLSIWYIPC